MASISVKEIMEWIQGRIVNAKEMEGRVEEVRVSRLSSLAVSKSDEVAFFFSRAFQHELPGAQAGVLITGEPFVKPMEAAQLPLWKKTVVIACADPYWGMAVLSEKFAVHLSTVAHVPSSNVGQADIHPTAVVDPSVELGEGVKIGPHCVIEAHARIGAGTVLYAGCFIGPRSSIGKNCVLFPRVTLYEWTQLGDRVRIHSGGVLGSDGFGYAPVKVAGQVSHHQKIFHLGRVVVGDDVEIGANSCVDRATFGETRIEKNAKLDNLVHVGHNARLDEGSIICGGTCLAGNASVGKYAYVGGLTGIGNHVHVGDGASVGALSMVTKDVQPGGTAVGNPQRDYKEHFRAHALLSRMLAERRKK